MSPNSLANYSILEINNVDDVILYSPVIIGERNKHFGEKGEWGMGVNILSAKNIQIFNLKVSNCWGDGIYIGGGSYGSSENIKINNAVIDFCRRNGISITDGDSIEIVNTIISNTQGTLPMCGVDIEPNDNNAIINKILIKNLLTFNNSNSGILIFLNQLQGNLKKKVDINIENHRDYNSDIGFMLGGYDQQNSIHQSFPGSINITNPQWINNQISIKCGDNLSKGPKVIFKNIKIKNNKETPKEVKNKLIKTENVVVVE